MRLAAQYLLDEVIKLRISERINNTLIRKACLHNQSVDLFTEPTRSISVGCDGENFSSPKECGLPPSIFLIYHKDTANREENKINLLFFIPRCSVSSACKIMLKIRISEWINNTDAQASLCNRYWFIHNEREYLDFSPYGRRPSVHGVAIKILQTERRTK